MENSIKLSAIHSIYPQLPDTCKLSNAEFDPDAPVKFAETNVSKILDLMHEAGRNKVDLVCTNEDIKGQGHFLINLDNPQIFTSMAEEIPGPTSRKIGEAAGQYGMYIAANYYEKDGNKIYNTSVLFGRKGEIIGKYRKIHLPVIEKWMVAPGSEMPVYETDIGKIGFAICYDMRFPEHCRAVALNGADIIIHQTQGWGIERYDTGEALLRVRAAENSVYLVVAKDIRNFEGPKSCIIDNSGRIIAEDGSFIEKIVTAEFIPDFDLTSKQFSSFFAGVESVKVRAALERVPSAYTVISMERNPLLEQHNDMELSTSQDKIRQTYEQWKEYEDDIENNRPPKLNYHWERW